MYEKREKHLLVGSSHHCMGNSLINLTCKDSQGTNETIYLVLNSRTYVETSRKEAEVLDYSQCL